MAVQKKTKPTRATSAAQWKKDSSAYPLVETPTGKAVRLKRPGMTKFLESGFLPDALASTIKNEISKASRKSPKAAEEAMTAALKDLSPDAALEMIESLDKIVCSVFVEPKCVWHRRQKRDDNGTPMVDSAGDPIMEDIPDEDRDDDVIYTDWIDQEDKNFVFQYAVGGSSDLTRFRDQQSRVMAAVESKSDVANPAQ